MAEAGLQGLHHMDTVNQRQLNLSRSACIGTIQEQPRKQTKVPLFFLSQRSGGKYCSSKYECGYKIHESRALMIVARSQSFQADFSSVAFHDDDDECGYGLVRNIQSYTALRGKEGSRMDILRLSRGTGAKLNGRWGWSWRWGLGGGGRRPKIKMGSFPGEA